MVDNVNGVGGMGATTPPRKSGKAYRFAEEVAIADSVEISSDVMRLSGVKGVRMEKVMQVRESIAAGRYFTPEKLDVSLDRALDEILAGG